MGISMVSKVVSIVSISGSLWLSISRSFAIVISMVDIRISMISMVSISVVVSIVIARISLCLSFTCHSSKQTQSCKSLKK